MFPGRSLWSPKTGDVAPPRRSGDDHFHEAQRCPNLRDDVGKLSKAPPLGKPYPLPRDKYGRLSLIDYERWAEVRAQLRVQGPEPH